MAKSRTLLNGKKIKEVLPKEYKWTMGSKCPSKYLIIDCEDGNMWVPVVSPVKRYGGPSAALVDAAKLAIACWEEIQKGQA
jgi:hypothetical protein